MPVLMPAGASVLDALLVAYRYVVCFTVIIFSVEMLFCLPNLPRRQGFWGRLAVLAPLLCVGLNSRFLSENFFHGWLISLMAMLVFLASLVVLYLLFDVSWGIVVFFGAAAYSVEGLLLFVRMGDDYFPWLFGPMGYARYLVELLLGAGVLVLAYRLLVLRYHHESAPDVSSGFLASFLIVVIFVVNLLSTWVRVDQLQSPVTALYGVTCNILLLALQFGVFKRSSLERERDLTRSIILERSRQEQQAQENVELINVKCHDLKRQIAALRSIPSSTERENAIADLEQAVMLYEAPTHTGNPAVDALLTERSLMCQSRQIALSCMVDGACLAGIGAVDLYALLGNALDNAIEAAAQVEEPSARLVSINVERRGQMALIRVENTCVGTPKMVDGLPVTTKGDTNYHGFGVRSIRMVVERFGGNMVIDTQDGLFVLSIVISIPPEGER